MVADVVAVREPELCERLTALKVAGPCGRQRSRWGLAGHLGQADTLNPSLNDPIPTLVYSNCGQSTCDLVISRLLGSKDTCFLMTCCAFLANITNLV